MYSLSGVLAAEPVMASGCGMSARLPTPRAQTLRPGIRVNAVGNATL